MIRGSGLSTADLLETIVLAIRNPGKAVYYKNHASHLGIHVTKFHLRTAREMIERLRLNIRVNYDSASGMLEFRSLHRGIEVKE